jgi:hypothetical protein
MTDDRTLTSPDPHRGPFGFMTECDLLAAFERTAADPDSATAAMLLDEMQHRGLAE